MGTADRLRRLERRRLTPLERERHTHLRLRLHGEGLEVGCVDLAWPAARERAVRYGGPGAWVAATNTHAIWPDGGIHIAVFVRYDPDHLLR